MNVDNEITAEGALQMSTMAKDVILKHAYSAVRHAAEYGDNEVTISLNHTHSRHIIVEELRKRGFRVSAPWFRKYIVVKW